MEYSRKSSLKWILLYLILGALAYGAIWYFFEYKNGGGSENSQTSIANSQKLGINYRATIEDSIENAGWKKYSNGEGKFSLEFPSDWKVDDKSEEGSLDSGPTKDVTFTGSEGFVQVSYGTGFGGMCEQGYETIFLGREKFYVCHYAAENDMEGWSIPGKDFGNFGIGAFAAANSPYIVNRNTILKIFSSFKFSEVGESVTPRIQSIVPYRGIKGTVVEIKGDGLSGFEGDLDVYFERPDGKRVMLTDSYGSYQKTQDTLIKVKVVEPCQKGEKVIGRYSGIESVCDYVELIPGIYKVYAEPWGKKSNVVNFEITK